MIQKINGMTGKGIPPAYPQLEFLKPIATPQELLTYLIELDASYVDAFRRFIDKWKDPVTG